MIIGIIFIIIGVAFAVSAIFLKNFRIILIISSATMFFISLIYFLLNFFLGGLMTTVEKMPSHKKGLKGVLEKAEKNLDDVNEMMDQQEKNDRIRSKGIDVKVKILSLKNSGKMVNYNPVFEFELLVEKDKYSTYTVKHRQIIATVFVPNLIINNYYDAKVDPENPQELLIDWI